MVKLPRSAEEIAVLEKATAVSEMALRRMMEMARPGTWHREVWLGVYGAMIAATGEVPVRLSLRSGAEGNTGGQPLNEQMAATSRVITSWGCWPRPSSSTIAAHASCTTRG
jgi:hypothetical protein